MDDDSMDEFGQWWDDADFEQEMIVGEGDLPDPSVMSRLEKGRFACTFTGCDKSYSHRRQCEDHYTSIHLNHPRYRCDPCNKTFSFKENWNSHNKNTHDGNVIRTPQVNGMSVSMLPSSSAGFSSSGHGGRNNNAAMVNANNHNSTPTSGNLLHTRLINGNVNNNNNSNSYGNNGHHHHHHNNQHQNNSKNNNHTNLHRSSSTSSHIRPQAMKPSRDLIPTPPPLHKLWTVSPPVVSASSHNHQHASPTAGGGGGSSTSIISSLSTPISVSSVQPVVPQPPLKLVLRLPTLEPAPNKKVKHEENSNISTSVIISTPKYSESAGEGSALSTCLSSGVQKLEVCPPNQTKACFKCKCCEGFFLSRVLFERHVSLKSEEQAAQDASSSSSPTTKSPPSCSLTTEVQMEK